MDNTNFSYTEHRKEAALQSTSTGESIEGLVSLQCDSQDSSAHPIQSESGGIPDFSLHDDLDAASCQDIILAAAKEELEHQQQQLRLLRGHSKSSDESETDAAQRRGHGCLPDATLDVAAHPSTEQVTMSDISLSGVIAELLDLKPAAFHQYPVRNSLEDQQPSITGSPVAGEDWALVPEADQSRTRSRAQLDSDGVQPCAVHGMHSRTSSGQMRRTGSGMSAPTSMESVMAACVGKVLSACVGHLRACYARRCSAGFCGLVLRSRKPATATAKATGGGGRGRGVCRCARSGGWRWATSGYWSTTASRPPATSKSHARHPVLARPGRPSPAACPAQAAGLDAGQAGDAGQRGQAGSERDAGRGRFGAGRRSLRH